MALFFDDGAHLDRATAPADVAPGTAAAALAAHGVALVVGPRAVAVAADGTAAWVTGPALAAAGVTVASDNTCIAAGSTTAWPLMWLGRRRRDGVPCYGLALTDGDAATALLAALHATLTPLRSVLMTLPPSDLAVAGAAAALASWHAATPFCAACGGATAPTHAGTRRACPSNHRAYPRVDPVAIALVANPDNAAALLVRPRARGQEAAALPFLTCVSGFVEAGEPVEAAVVREVVEETGVAIHRDTVKLVASQGWPIGRAGGCELMVGCAAVAASTSLDAVNHDELAEARWVTRADVAAALAGSESATFRAPPAGAVASELLRAWVAGDGVWSRL